MASLSWPASPIHVVTGLGVDQLRRSRPTRFDRYTKPASQIPCSLINTPRRIGYVGRPTAFGRYVFHTPGEKRNYVVGLWAFAALRTVIMCYNVDANWYFHLPVATVERRYTCPVLYWCCTDPNVDIRGPPIHLQLVEGCCNLLEEIGRKLNWGCFFWQINKTHQSYLQICSVCHEMQQWRRRYLVVVGAIKGWGMGRGVPSPWGKGLKPPPRKFSDFWRENDVFWCIFGTIFSNCS